MNLHCLFVGGLVDGEWRAVPVEKTTIKVAERRGLPRLSAVASEGEAIPTDLVVREQTYRATAFAYQKNGLQYRIFAPMEWEDAAVLTTLAEGYLRGKRRD